MAKRNKFKGWAKPHLGLEIRFDDAGAIDEIVAVGCAIHIEQMSDDGWFLLIEDRKGGEHRFWLGSKNRRAHVEVRHTESTEPA